MGQPTRSRGTRPPWRRSTTRRRSDACAAASRYGSGRDPTSAASVTRRTHSARCSCGAARRRKVRRSCERRWRSAQRAEARSSARRCITWPARSPKQRRTTRGGARPSTPTGAPCESGRRATVPRARRWRRHSMAVRACSRCSIAQEQRGLRSKERCASTRALSVRTTRVPTMRVGASRRRGDGLATCVAPWSWRSSRRAHRPRRAVQATRRTSWKWLGS